MSGTGNLNLSLLARGVGQIQNHGDKIEVKLEPADYFNWKDDFNRHFTLPPISNQQRALIPKTFITRKGALLLFSEDLAKTSADKEKYTTDEKGDDESLDLRTVEDLTRSILAYGNRRTDESVCLKFVRDRKSLKIIRPGYSPRRYLASWTKFFDTGFVTNLTSKGFLHEKNLYQTNEFLPHIRYPVRSNMSNYPTPYRLMRQMLMSPGSLAGYTFYWTMFDGIGQDGENSVNSGSDKQSSEFNDGDEGVEFTRLRLKDREKTLVDGAIYVVKTDGDGLVREVTYSELDTSAQQDVLTDLLVKSAISHALMRKEKQMADTEKRLFNSPSLSVIESGLSVSSDTESQRDAMFDMVEAVQSLLDNPIGGVFDSRIIPDHDETQKNIRAHYAVRPRVKKSSRSYVSSSGRSDTRSEGVQSWPDSGEREYCGNIPVATLKTSTSSDDVSVCSAPAAPKQSSGLPYMSTVNMNKRSGQLSPIKDVSYPPTRGSVTLPPIVSHQKKVAVSLPDLNIEPPTPSHTTLSRSHLSRSLSHGAMRQNSNVNTGDKVDGPSSDGEDKPKRKRKKTKDKLAKEPIPPIQKSESHVGISGVFSSDFGNTNISHVNTSSLPGKKAPDAAGFRTKSPSFRLRLQKRSTQNHLLENTSFPGSVVVAPDGVVVPVGGHIDMADSVADSGVGVDSDRHDAAQLDAELATLGARMAREADRLGLANLTEEELLIRLRQHAEKIAARVLRRFGAGKDLAKDAMQAATIWENNFTPTESMKAAEELEDDDEEADLILNELMKANGLTDLDPQSALYKELLKQALSKALNIDIPEDAEISADLLAALASGQLNPDDIEIVFDEKTGKHIVRLKRLTADRLKKMPVEAQAKILASLSLEERSRLLASMTDEDKKKLLASLGMEEKAKILAAMSFEERERLLAGMTEEEKAALLNMLPPEERARLVAALSEEERTKYLATLSTEEKAKLLMSVSVEERAKILASLSQEEKEKLLATLGTEEKAKLIAAMTMEEREKILANMSTEEKEKLFASLGAEDKARLIAALSEEERQQLLANMSTEEKAAILASLSLDERIKVLNSLSDEDKQKLINELPPDQKAKILAAMSEEEREKILAGMSLEEKSELLRALSPESKAKLLAAMSSEEREQLLAEMSTEEKAKMMKNLSAEEQAKILSSMSVEERAKVLAQMSEEERQQLLDSLPPEEKAKIIIALSKEERAKLLANMTDEEKQALIDALPTEEKGQILAALSHEERAKILANMSDEEKLKMLNSLGVEDRAKLLEAMTAEEKMKLLDSLPLEEKAKILAALSNDERAYILSTMTMEEKLRMIEALDPEERARILASLSKEERDKLIAALPPDQQAATLKALKSFLRAERERSKTMDVKRPEFVVGRPKDTAELARLYGPYDPKGNVMSSSVSRRNSSTKSLTKIESPPSKAPPPTPEQSSITLPPIISEVTIPEEDSEDVVATSSQPPPPPPPPPPGDDRPGKDVHLPLTLPKFKPPTKKETKKPPKEPSKKKDSTRKEKPKVRKSQKEKPAKAKKSDSPEVEISEEEEEEEDERLEAEVEPTVVELEEMDEEPAPLKDSKMLDTDEGRRMSGMSDADTMRSTSSLRAAQRVAIAEKRKKEVEHKRRQREEVKKKEAEEAERREIIKLEVEEERRKKDEEIRTQREKVRRQREKAAIEAEERDSKMRDGADKERRLRDDERKKLEEFKRRQADDNTRRQALNRQREEEERQKKLDEERMLYEMSEQERMEYERRKKEEAERKAREAAEDKARREAEIAKAMEDARKLAEEMARRKKELEERLNFNRGLHTESDGMSHTQDVSRSFVWSYFDLLEWLGLEMPKEGF